MYVILMNLLLLSKIPFSIPDLKMGAYPQSMDCVYYGTHMHQVRFGFIQFSSEESMTQAPFNIYQKEY